MNEYDKILKEAYLRGKEAGIEEGIAIGMKRHFEIASDLSDDEQKLLLEFLSRHNMVLCYEPMYGGFAVRSAKPLNPRKERQMFIVMENDSQKCAVNDENSTYANTVNTAIVSIARGELIRMQTEKLDRELAKT